MLTDHIGEKPLWSDQTLGVLGGGEPLFLSLGLSFLRLFPSVLLPFHLFPVHPPLSTNVGERRHALLFEGPPEKQTNDLITQLGKQAVAVCALPCVYNDILATKLTLQRPEQKIISKQRRYNESDRRNITRRLSQNPSC